MRVDVIVADAAQCSSGKVSLLGGGWSFIRAPQPIAVVIFFEIPWHETNKKKAFTVELLDADGRRVEFPGTAGQHQFVVEGQIEAGRPPGVWQGTPVALEPIVINVPPLLLTPGRYTFKVSVDDHSEETWQRTFTRVENSPSQ